MDTSSISGWLATQQPLERFLVEGPTRLARMSRAELKHIVDQCLTSLQQAEGSLSARTGTASRIDQVTLDLQAIAQDVGKSPATEHTGSH